MQRGSLGWIGFLKCCFTHPMHSRRPSTLSFELCRAPSRGRATGAAEQLLLASVHGPECFLEPSQARPELFHGRNCSQPRSIPFEAGAHFLPPHESPVSR